MNIKTGSVEQLSKLLRACDDDADSHVVWVAFNGDVHIDRAKVFEEKNPAKEYYNKTRLKSVDGFIRFDMEACDYAAKGKIEYRKENAGSEKFMFQFETLCQGNGYAGKSGAEDSVWVNQLLSMLKADYNQGTLGLTQFA